MREEREQSKERVVEMRIAALPDEEFRKHLRRMSRDE
jgi:hypothetical protein